MLQVERLSYVSFIYIGTEEYGGIRRRKTLPGIQSLADELLVGRRWDDVLLCLNLFRLELGLDCSFIHLSYFAQDILCLV
jgi:hypothetical protein